MSDFNFKSFVVSFAFLLVGLVLRIMGLIDSLAFLGVGVFGMLVPFVFSRSIEEVTIKGVALIKRFQPKFDEDERKRADSYMDAKAAELVRFNEDKATALIADLVQQGHQKQDSIILGLLKQVDALERRLAILQNSQQSWHSDFAVNPCPIHGSSNLCRDERGIFCNCCGDYVCHYRTA